MSFLIYQINVNIVNIFVILECKCFFTFYYYCFCTLGRYIPEGFEKKMEN